MALIPFQEFTSQDWQIYYQSIATTQTKTLVGQGISMALAAVKDYLADRIRLSIKSKLPLPGYAPPDALIQIGIERGIPANPGETDLAYSIRLLNAWLTWPMAGTHKGVLRALYDAGYLNVGILQQLGGWYTLDGSQNLVITPSPRFYFDSRSPLVAPTSWLASNVYSAGAVIVPVPQNGCFYVSSGGGTSGPAQPVIWPKSVGAIVQDGGVFWQCKGQDFWSRFAVLFFTPYPSSWGGTPPIDGSSEAIRVANLIRNWKSAHATCVTIVIPPAGEGTLWGYPGPINGKTWGGASAVKATWGANTSPLPTYWTP